MTRTTSELRVTSEAPRHAALQSGELVAVQAAARLQSIGLDDLDAQAGLLSRVDRKYLLPVHRLTELVDALGGDWAVLDIDGRRVFGYESTYFDTPDLLTYRAHLQGRRLRFKVRVRTYLDSGQSMLEVKLKGQRGLTVKERTRHVGERRDHLGVEGESFVGRCLMKAYGQARPPGLRPVLTTVNKRLTMVALTHEARLTVDLGVTGSDGTREVIMKPGYVLVESKAGPSGSEADRILRAIGVRPLSVSKYCVGVAVLRQELPSNPWHRTLRLYFDPVHELSD